MKTILQIFTLMIALFFSALSIFAHEYNHSPGPSPVPEPSTYTLMGAGVLALIYISRRKAGARAASKLAANAGRSEQGGEMPMKE